MIQLHSKAAAMVSVRITKKVKAIESILNIWNYKPGSENQGVFIQIEEIN